MKFELFAILLFSFKVLDIPSLIFKIYNSRLDILASVPFSRCIPHLRVLCCLCDLLVAFKKRSITYLLYASLFPTDISSITNCISMFPSSLFDGVLCFLDPIYFSCIQSPIKSCLEIFLIYNDVSTGWKSPASLASTVFDFIRVSYLNGYKNNHIPGLNGFWYFHTCMIQQYSKLSYSLILILANFFLRRESRLLPIFRNHSSFISFLPYIYNSKLISIYTALGLSFEYLFMLFRTVEIVNTNFLYWFTLFFCILYLYDIRFGSLSIKHKPFV